MRDVDDEAAGQDGGYANECSDFWTPGSGFEREGDHDETIDSDTNDHPDACDDEEEGEREAKIREERAKGLGLQNSRECAGERIRQQEEQQQPSINNAKDEKVNSGGPVSSKVSLQDVFPYDNGEDVSQQPKDTDCYTHRHTEYPV